MSDALPIMSGPSLSQETGSLANAQGKSAGRGEGEQFPALFQSIMQDGSATTPVDGMLMPPVVAPVDVSFLNPDGESLLPDATGQDGSASATTMTALPLFAAETGNALPQFAWSGYFAVADDDGAAALAMQGDQDIAVSSKPVLARDLPNAILRAQEQVANAQLQQAAIPMSEETDFNAMMNKEGLPALHMERQLMLDNMPTQGQASATTVTQPHTAMVNDLSGLVASAARGGDNTTQQINLPVQHPQWAQQVGDRVQWQIGQNLQQAEIRLNPPELGALEVRIQLHGDQASVSFSSPHAVVRDALDAAMPRLREMLHENGLTLGDVNVSGQALAQHQSQDPGNQQGQRGQMASPVQADESPTQRLTSSIQRLNSNGMLDVYA